MVRGLLVDGSVREAKWHDAGASNRLLRNENEAGATESTQPVSGKEIPEVSSDLPPGHPHWP